MTLLKFSFGPISLKNITVGLGHCLIFDFWSRVILKSKSSGFQNISTALQMEMAKAWRCWFSTTAELSWLHFVCVMVYWQYTKLTVMQEMPFLVVSTSCCEQLDLCRITCGVLASFTLVPLFLLPRKDTWLAEKRENAMLGLLVLWTTWHR